MKLKVKLNVKNKIIAIATLAIPVLRYRTEQNRTEQNRRNKKN
jgi:hypothetical protein